MKFGNLKGNLRLGLVTSNIMKRLPRRNCSCSPDKGLEPRYNEFQKSNSKSLLKKYLTPKVFSMLKDKKTSYGSGLLDVIQSGLANHDSAIGVYAPDEEAYRVFAPLFNPIIEEYHEGFKACAVHPPLNWGNPNALKNLDPSGKYIVSTRVRCGRSIKRFPFNPRLTLAQYTEMEEQMCCVLSSLHGEFEGTFYPLTGMRKDVQQKLINDHFLFKQGDRFLKEANATRFWPIGRAIFHNEKKTFLVWCNEEDHLRIISMQPGGDLGAVYRRLVAGVTEIAKKFNFVRDSRLGYLTFCPTNLGTTIRASVHIKLPNLSTNLENLEAIAAKYNLQVRGTAGEHSETVGGVYDISNKRRLGLTEFEAVMEMQNGILAIIQHEMEYAEETGAKGGSLESRYKKLLESDSKSLLRKYLTQEVFNRLKSKKTSFGSGLVDVIQSGLANFDSGIGVYAPDTDSYQVFAELFDPIIEEYHGGFKPTDQHPASDWGDVSSLVNLDPTGEFVVSTRVRCGRSLQGYPFNPTLTEDMYMEMEEKVSEVLSSLDGELQGTFYPLTGMRKDVQQKLIDDHFLFKEGDRFLQAANACRFWPTGRGIFHNDDKTFLVWVNEEDHLRIISMQKGGDLGEVFRRLVSGVQKIEEKLPFARDDRLGYLTFCPTNLGTTIRASVHIKVPKLASNKANLDALAAKYNLQVRGTSGEHSESIGGIYDISNRRRLGLTEFDAVMEMQTGILEIIRREKEAGTSEPGYMEMKYKELQASSSRSLLKKYLTPDLFEKLKDKKTSFNSGLMDVIQSGLANFDSGIGVYAPDTDSYKVFAALFDPIIQDYHGGFKPTDRHPPSLWGDLTTLINLDPKGKYVVSTRVRCGRSLQGYPLNPTLTEAQYVEMENKISTILSSLGGELKGKFYPLTGMSKEVQQKLIDDHFLFKEGDRFLQAANACRFWPTGRGIFHNDDKTFLVWVNEEDHLRIISMQKGGDLGEVFRRLVSGVQEIEKKIPFARDDRLGYLTFCPTNLGTTIRASVHIKVPRLSSNMKDLETVADYFNLQVRGTSGEHSESIGGIYDISNKRRLGLTEYDAVMEMQKGILEIIKQEQMEELFEQLIKSDSKSLLKKYLSRGRFNKLKLKRTSFGSGLMDVIQSGLQNLDSGIGVYAPDTDAYTVFSDLFNLIIQDYHGGFKPTDRHPKSDWGNVKSLINLDPEGEYVVSTRVRCGRSLQGYPFNPTLTEAQYKQMEIKVSNTLMSLEGELKGNFYPLTGMTKEVQQKLIDDHFLFKEGDRFLQTANACRFWPTGRGIYHNDNKTFLVWVNEEDHLRIISMQMGGDLGEVFRRLVSGVQEIEKKLPFARDDRLGYLTFCPTNLGTTIRASVHIKVPKLAANKQNLDALAAKHNLQVRGTSGEHTESVGGVYDISNKRRLGLTEFEAVMEMQSGILEIIKAERNAS